MICLTKDHIDQLYDFVSRHFVPWYDLQTELVDHLATGIEQLSVVHPEKSFEQLLEMEFRKFGVHGFEDVVAKRMNALSKEYYRLVLKRAGIYFKWPVILQSVFFVAAFYFLFSYFRNEWMLPVVMIAVTSFAIFGFLRLPVLKQRYEYHRKRKWLLQDIIFHMGGGAVFFMLPMQILSFVIDDYMDTFSVLWARIVLALGTVVYLRLIQVTCWVIPSQIDSILEERYKTYKFSE